MDEGKVIGLAGRREGREVGGEADRMLSASSPEGGMKDRERHVGKDRSCWKKRR